MLAKFIIIRKLNCYRNTAPGEIHTGDSFLRIKINILGFGNLFNLSTTFLLQWFNDVYSTDISDKCEDVLNMLSKNHGCKVSSFLVS